MIYSAATLIYTWYNAVYILCLCCSLDALPDATVRRRKSTTPAPSPLLSDTRLANHACVLWSRLLYILPFSIFNSQVSIRLNLPLNCCHLTPGSAVLILQVGESTLVRSHGSTLSITCKVGQTISVSVSCTMFSVVPHAWVSRGVHTVEVNTIYNTNFIYPR